MTQTCAPRPGSVVLLSSADGRMVPPSTSDSQRTACFQSSLLLHAAGEHRVASRHAIQLRPWCRQHPSHRLASPVRQLTESCSSPPPPHAAHPMAPLWPVNKEARALPRASSVGHWLDSVSRGGKSAAHVACRCEELVATACSGAELGGSGHTRPPSAVPLRPAVALSTNAHTCLPRASAACALHGALGHAAAVPTAGPCSSGAARSAVRPEALAHDAWSMVNHAQAVGCTVCW